MSDCECGHPVGKHPDLGACMISGCECHAFVQGGGAEEPGRWMPEPDWKGGD